jgi:hypothetical protein
MKKLAIIALLILAGCIGGFKTFTSENIDCGENVQAPKVSLEVVKEYAPVLMMDVVSNAPSFQCVDRRYVGLVPPECRGEGWGCAVLDPYFWGFAEKGQSVEVFVLDVPGKGVGLHYEMPRQDYVRVIICEMMPVKKGMEQVAGLLKDLCYSDAGGETGNFEFCSKISGSDVKKECEARTYRDPKRCEGISADPIKFKCFSEIAFSTKELSICNFISDSGEKENCRLRITGYKPPTKGAVISS